ncbi:MAG: hypothetical protein ACE5OP_13915 [Candidatus Glassbacteria bacterium]
MTCSIVSGTYYSVNYGLTQRGIGYDASRHEIWVGSWNDYYINQHDANPPYIQISSNYVGLPIASIATVCIVCDGHPDIQQSTSHFSIAQRKPYLYLQYPM